MNNTKSPLPRESLRPDEQRLKTINSDSNNVITTRYYAGSYQKDTTNGTSKKIHYIMGGPAGADL